MDPKDAASVDQYRNCLKNMGSEVAVSLGKAVFYGDYRDVLEQVQISCTIIQSTNDRAVPNNVGHYLQNKICSGASSLVFVDMDGHFPMLTSHLKLVEVLKGVMDSEKPCKNLNGFGMSV